MGHATPELHPLLNLRKPSIALVYDSQVLYAKDAVKSCCAMAVIGSRETLEPEIRPALPVALNFERASPESGTKLPLHYFTTWNMSCRKCNIVL